MPNPEYLRIAIQKSGRLGDESLDILRKSGFSFSFAENARNLVLRATNFPLEILLLRVGDIPHIVKEGLVDLGIVGENSLYEKDISQLEVIEQLGFGKCKLCLAAPDKGDIFTAEDFEGKVIATSYPNLTKKFFAEKSIHAEVVELSGSHEIAPQMGIADGICDIVSTGSTLAANKLKNITQIFSSQAVLIGKTGAKDVLKSKRIDDFLMRLHSVLRAKNLKSLIMNAPESALPTITSILPSLESPTVTPLAEKGWVAIHSVAKEDEHFWDLIDALKKAGATGILVFPIDRVID